MSAERRYLVGKRTEEPAEAQCLRCMHFVHISLSEWRRRGYPSIRCHICAQDIPLAQLYTSPP